MTITTNAKKCTCTLVVNDLELLYIHNGLQELLDMKPNYLHDDELITIEKMDLLIQPELF